YVLRKRVTLHESVTTTFVAARGAAPRAFPPHQPMVADDLEHARATPNRRQLSCSVSGSNLQFAARKPERQSPPASLRSANGVNARNKSRIYPRPSSPGFATKR